MLSLNIPRLSCFALSILVSCTYIGKVKASTTTSQVTNATSSARTAGHYIVVFKGQTPADVIEEHHGWLETFDPNARLIGHSRRSTKSSNRHKEPLSKPASLKRVFRRISFGPSFALDDNASDASVSRKKTPFNAYVGQFDADILDHIEKREEVEYVVPDHPVRLVLPVHNQKKRSFVPLASPPTKAETAVPFSHGNGTGVIAYVVDSGIYAEHSDFENRVAIGPNFIQNEANIDECGHGSHVAGTIGGKTHGLANGTRMVSVKVFDHQGNSNTSTVMAGVEWAAKDALKHYDASAPDNPPFKGALINMSMSAPRNKAFNDLINTIALDQGIPVIIAAGNEGRDACAESPASAEGAITVMAIDSRNRLAQFSDRGACTSIAAPGVDVVSVGTKNPHATRTESGTSMAAAVVSGVISSYMSSFQGYGTLRASEIEQALIQLSIKNAITNLDPGTDDSPNRIVAFAPQTVL